MAEKRSRSMCRWAGRLRQAPGTFPGAGARALVAATGGSAAVEFAFVAPLFLLLLFGVISYSTILAAYSGVQQLVAEGARATLSGLSVSERDQLARSFIATNAAAYPFLDPTKLTVSTAATTGTAPTFQVTVSYDMSSSFAYGLYGLLPLPGRTIRRTAVVQLGGF